MSATPFCEAVDDLLAKLASGKPIPITKRVTNDMVRGYVKEGWTIWKREERTVLLVWKKAGEPT